MPSKHDGISDAEVSIDSADKSNDYNQTKGNVMDPEIYKLHTSQLTQTGLVAQNNFVTVQKVVDYDYLENKRIVTLDEAIGVREVASKNVPAGPTSV